MFAKNFKINVLNGSVLVCLMLLCFMFCGVALVLAEGSALNGQAASTSSVVTSLMPLLLVVAVFYFLILRPQQKRAKEHSIFIQGLKKGDKVMVAGGIYGNVQKVDEKVCNVEVAPGVTIKVQKETIVATQGGGNIISREKGVGRKSNSGSVQVEEKDNKK
jgi:preprotein translocase subunit YajC